MVVIRWREATKRPNTRIMAMDDMWMFACIVSRTFFFRLKGPIFIADISSNFEHSIGCEVSKLGEASVAILGVDIVDVWNAGEE